MNRCWLVWCAAACAGIGAPAWGQAAADAGDTKSAVQEDAASGRAIFEEAWSLVKTTFYDEGMHGVDWEAVRERFLADPRLAGPGPARSAVINEAVGTLKASHTRHFGPWQREYYELLDVFHPEGVGRRSIVGVPEGRLRYVGIGVVAKEIGGEFFAADVYPGGPADEAGIRVGDRLVGAGDGPWGDIEPFKGRAGKPTAVMVQRRTGGPVVAVDVVPREIQPRDEFLAMIERDRKIETRDGLRLGYLRVRSYAHESYQDAVLEAVTGELSACDGLVLDLRGGWGGAQPSYMNAFNPAAPEMDVRGRSTPWNARPTAWRGPLVVLIDGGTRSGKEILAHAFRTSGIARLVGTRTAGAVLGGRLTALSDGSVLMVAVTDVKVDGERLEGKGVEPHVQVEWDVRYAEGKDVQREAGMEELVRVVRGRK